MLLSSVNWVAEGPPFYTLCNRQATACRYDRRKNEGKGMLSVLMSEPPGGGSWEEDALCREYDSRLWILSEDVDQRQANKDHFEEAEVICSRCPVFSECWEHATYTDKKVTMRAGAWPTEYVAPPPVPKRDDHCVNGHDLRVDGAKDKHGKCLECNRERVRRYRARQVAKKAAGV